MIHVKNAQSILSKIHTKYEIVQEQTNSALVCISTNFIVCVNHNSENHTATNDTNFFYLFESINELTCMGTIVISEEIYRNFIIPTFLID